MPDQHGQLLQVPQGFNSRGEKGIRWARMYDTRTKKKSFALFCECRKLVGIRPRKDGTLCFVHGCGFERDLLLEDFN